MLNPTAPFEIRHWHPDENIMWFIESHTQNSCVRWPLSHHFRPRTGAIGRTTVDPRGNYACCFALKSFTAALMASSANIEQCSLTGGSFRCDAISEFLIDKHSSTDLPFIHSVANEDDAESEDKNDKRIKFSNKWMSTNNKRIKQQ